MKENGAPIHQSITRGTVQKKRRGDHPYTCGEATFGGVAKGYGNQGQESGDNEQGEGV